MPDVKWSHHEDRPESEDRMTECGRFEALMDPVYGHYNVQRTDWELTDAEAAKDALVAQVVNLADATPAIESYQTV
jgi:hypothetical protein